MRLNNGKMTNDPALLQRARQMDEDALAEIYDTFSPRIYGYALRLSGDSDTAEECVAETFSRFLEALHKGHGPADYLQAYLYRVAHNWLTDLYRRKRPESALDPELRAGDRDDPQAAVSERLEQQELRLALGQLTADQQQVIALKYLEQMEHAEIAEMLQKPVGAIKALQHRGLASLRRILAGSSRNAPAPAPETARDRPDGLPPRAEGVASQPDGLQSRPDAPVT